MYVGYKIIFQAMIDEPGSAAEPIRQTGLRTSADGKAFANTPGIRLTSSKVPMPPIDNPPT